MKEYLAIAMIDNDNGDNTFDKKPFPYSEIIRE